MNRYEREVQLWGLLRSVLPSALAGCDENMTVHIPLDDDEGGFAILSVVVRPTAPRAPPAPGSATEPQRGKAKLKPSAKGRQLRRACLDIVDTADGRITLPSVEEELQGRGLGYDHTSVWRCLENLADGGFVRRAQPDGYAPIDN